MFFRKATDLFYSQQHVTAETLTDCLCFDLMAHRFESLGLKSRINAMIALVLTFWLHRFSSLGLKSRIDAQIALVLTSLLHRLPILGLKSGITAVPSCRQVEWPACHGRSRYDAASDSIFLRRKVERFRLQEVFTATMPRPILIFVAAK